jgi:MtN3 and saliva related transmembrane protein
MQPSLVENIGFAAATCTTLSFVPQLTKIRKQGGRDLSYAMLCVYLLGLALWLTYGIFLHAPAVIVANAASIVLVVAAIVMKATISAPPEVPS